MPANRSWLLWTSILALAIGVVLGTWLVPSWRAGGRINAVASPDFQERADAWNWWRAPADDGTGPRAATVLNQLGSSLADAPPDAFLHGAEELSRLGLWNWQLQEEPLMHRHLELLAWRAHVIDMEDAINLIESAPPGASIEPSLPSIARLLEHRDEKTARDAFHALVGWTGFGPSLVPLLDALPESRSDWGVPYRAWADSGPVPIAPIVDLADPLNPPEEVLDSSNTVALSMLVTEDIFKARPELQEQAMRGLPARLEDPDPVRRQGAVLLSCLLGIHEQEIAEAMLLEENALTRTTMRLALDGLGKPWGRDDPAEFAWRTLVRDDGSLWYQPILTRLLAGDPSLLEPLLASAAGRDELDCDATYRLVVRFLPDWIATSNGPEVVLLPEDVFFERLLARWHLEGHRLRSDGNGRFLVVDGL